MPKKKIPQEENLIKTAPPISTGTDDKKIEPAPTSPKSTGPTQQPAIKVSEKDVIKAILDYIQADVDPDKKSLADETIREYIRQDVVELEVSTQYNLLFLHDDGTMLKADADFIYSAAKAFVEKKPILLVLYSSGGIIGSAYLIGQLCRKYTKDKLVVAVPRQAKSSATLLCCAADEIHMGSLSELGPIDPQIDNLPTLGLKSSVNHICELIKEHPHAASMFAKYLSLSLEPIQLGYYERVAESAAQYAERLLNTHATLLKKQPNEIAKILVYSYKDHGFVIDKSEALEIFGPKTIKTDTPEYKLGNIVYEKLTFISRIANALDHTFYFIGSFDSPLHFTKKS